MAIITERKPIDKEKMATFAVSIRPEREYEGCEHPNRIHCYIALAMVHVHKDGTEEHIGNGGIVVGEGGYLGLCPDCGAFFNGYQWIPPSEWLEADAPDEKTPAVEV